MYGSGLLLLLALLLVALALLFSSPLARVLNWCCRTVRALTA
jgi:hypothetical protein